MKKKRHEKIREIINQHIVETQDELLGYLREEGFDVTQATVSRDIKELRLVKALDPNEIYRYMSPKGENISSKMNYSEIFSSAVVSVDYAMNDVVIKCHSGMANAAGAAIDNMQLAAVIGTIAGDDTILIITRGEQQAQNLCLELTQLMSAESF